MIDPLMKDRHKFVQFKFPKGVHHIWFAKEGIFRICLLRKQQIVGAPLSFIGVLFIIFIEE